MSAAQRIDMLSPGAMESVALADELTALMAGRSALVVEGQTPIALEIRELLLDHGAADIRLASSLPAARRELATGFRPYLAVVDIVRFDAEAGEFIAFLQGEAVALVLTMATRGRRPGEQASTTIVTKPYFESELKAAVIAALRAARTDG